MAGPSWQAGRTPRTKRWLATLPLVALVLCAWAAAATSLGPVRLESALGRTWHGLPLLVASTLICMVLAIPAACGPGLIWLVPAWLAASLGVAGWSLAVWPPTPLARALQAACVLLPFMVAGLAGAASGMPAALSRAAAASGAGPVARAGLLARSIWPGMLRTSLAVLALGSAFLAGGL